MKVSIKTYSDLFNLWSTNIEFRSKHPYLVDLKNYMLSMMKKGYLYNLSHGDAPEDIIKYLLNMGKVDDLTQENLEKYIHPYIRSKVVDGTMLSSIISESDRSTKLVSIVIDVCIKYGYKYVFHKRGAYNETYDVSVLFAHCSDSQLKTALDAGLIEFRADTRYHWPNAIDMIRLYDLTHRICHKPTTEDLILYGFGKYDIFTKESDLIQVLKYIKKENLVWYKVFISTLYDIIRDGRDKIVEGGLKAIYPELFVDKNGNFKSTYLGSPIGIRRLFECIDIYGYDINTKIDGSQTLWFNIIKLIYYNMAGYELLGELLDHGFKLFDDNGKLVIDELYSGSNNQKVLYEYLIKYYEEKNNQLAVDELKRTFPLNIIVYVIKLEDDVVDWSSINDDEVRNKMQAKYMKLQLKAKGILV